MTTLLDQAFDTIRQLPTASQDEIAHLMLALAQKPASEPEAIDPAHLSNVLEGLAQAQRRQFASESDIAAAFSRFTV